MEITADELKGAVQKLHGCTAHFAQSVPVREMVAGQPVWEGIVYIFKLVAHPQANLAYAWSSPVEGSDKRRIYAMLHIPPIDSPAAAVRARAPEQINPMP